MSPGLLCKASGEPVAAAALAAWAVVGETLDTLEPDRCGRVLLLMVACCICSRLLCTVKQCFPGSVPKIPNAVTWPCIQCAMRQIKRLVLMLAFGTA